MLKRTLSLSMLCMVAVLAQPTLLQAEVRTNLPFGWTCSPVAPVFPLEQVEATANSGLYVEIQSQDLLRTNYEIRVLTQTADRSGNLTEVVSLSNAHLGTTETGYIYTGGGRAETAEVSVDPIADQLGQAQGTLKLDVTGEVIDPLPRSTLQELRCIETR